MVRQSQFLIFKRNFDDAKVKSPIIVVGKNVSKKATERNLLKRRIRSILRQSPFKNKFNFKIITRPGILELPFKELKEIISKKENFKND